VAIQLTHLDLFRWTGAGFWAWIASILFFVINPLASIFWNMGSYRTNLALSGGLSRGIWIGCLTFLALIVFFSVYIRTGARPVDWNIPSPDDGIQLPTGLIMVGFLAVAGYSLLTYRANVIQTAQSVTVISGRFAGEATGYQYIAHQFAFVPIFMLLLSKPKWMQVSGLLLSLGYVWFKMQDSWGRWAVVSLLIGISIVFTIQQKKRWPSFLFIAAISAFAAVLIMRGHTNVTNGQGFYDLISRLPDQLGPKLASNNTDMLSYWYFDSYIKDQVTGYEYGIPLLNYLFAGFLPGRFFPNKYFLLDWFHSLQPALDLFYSNRLIGAKWTLFGSFYDNGGVIALVLFSAGLGWLCRKLDGMLTDRSPLLVKAIGVSWLCVLWMVWASQDYWAAEVLGSLAIPGLVIRLFSGFLLKKTSQAQNRQKEAYPMVPVDPKGSRPV
jgi:hypothetical protein